MYLHVLTSHEKKRIFWMPTWHIFLSRTFIFMHEIVKCQPHRIALPVRFPHFQRNTLLHEGRAVGDIRWLGTLCTNTDKFKPLCLQAWTSLIYNLGPFSVVSDKARRRRKHMFCVCCQRLSGTYLPWLHQGQNAVHPKTLQAPNYFSDGTQSSWSRHGTHSHNIWVRVFQQT